MKSKAPSTAKRRELIRQHHADWVAWIVPFWAGLEMPADMVKKIDEPRYWFRCGFFSKNHPLTLALNELETP